jgi:hypothetical protein
MRNHARGMSWGGVVWNAFIWLVVPGTLFWLGYNVVGPRVGSVPGLESQVSSIAGKLNPEETGAPVAAGDAKRTDPADTKPGVPEVEITVEKSKEQPKPRRRRIRRARPAPQPEADQPRRDEASGDAPTPPPEDPPAELPAADPGTGDG